MDNTSLLIITGLAGLVIGFVVAKLMEKGKASRNVSSAKREAGTILKAANVEGGEH